jgi:hypothetical protein
VRAKRGEVTNVGCGVIGHARVDHAIGNIRRCSDRHIVEGDGEGLRVTLPGPRGLGWRHHVRHRQWLLRCSSGQRPGGGG